MSAAACARAASDLTALVERLDRTRRGLERQSHLPEDDFGGLSGDAYRRHASRSAVTVAGAGVDLALLAGALAALGRELAAAEEIRDQAAGSPERARELRARAREVEHRGQERWRSAVASYEGRAPDWPPVGRPVVAEPVVAEPVVAEPVVAAGGPPPPTDHAAPAVASPPAPTSVAPPASPPAVPGPRPEPALDSAFVTSPPELESELITPPTESAH